MFGGASARGLFLDNGEGAWLYFRYVVLSSSLRWEHIPQIGTPSVGVGRTAQPLWGNPRSVRTVKTDRASARIPRTDNCPQCYCDLQYKRRSILGGQQHKAKAFNTTGLVQLPKRVLHACQSLEKSDNFRSEILQNLKAINLLQDYCFHPKNVIFS